MVDWQKAAGSLVVAEWGRKDLGASFSTIQELLKNSHMIEARLARVASVAATTGGFSTIL